MKDSYRRKEGHSYLDVTRGPLRYRRRRRVVATDVVKYTIVSLTVITLTVYMAVFEYQNQVIFNMTVFDVGSSLSY
jgi:hypothetical protein